MQEFIIKSDEDNTEINQPPFENNVAPIPPKEDKLKEEFVAINKVEPKAKGSGLNPIIAFMMFALVISTFFAFFFAFKYFKLKKETNQKSENNGEVLGETNTIENTSEEKNQEEFRDKLFYTDNINIYRASKNGKNIIKLTNYDNNRSRIYELEIINENFLGYFRCETSCQINKLDIKTRKSSLVKEIEPSMKPVQLTWEDDNKLVYTFINNQTQELNIVYFDNGNELLIDKILIAQGNRPSFIEDSWRLEFSPNKDKFLHIHTTSEYGLNFTTKIYDKKGNLFGEIYNSTMPAWKDNNSIVYRNYSNQNAGYLYEYNINSKQIEKIASSMPLSYLPQIANQYVVYWEGNKNIFLLDLNTKENKLIAGNYINPIWLSQNEIILASLRNCEEYECETYGTFEYELQSVIAGYYIYNIQEEKFYDLEINPEHLNNGISTWISKHARNDFLRFRN